MSNTKKLLIVCAIPLLIILGYFSYKYFKQDKNSLKLGIDAGAIVSAPLFIADEMGFWKDEGIDVKLINFTSGKEAVGALLSGSVDFASMTDLAFMIAAHRDSSLRLIMTITSSPMTHQIVCNGDRGIHNISDLRGKKIGVTIGTGGHYYLDKTLATINLTNSDIQKINLSPPNLSSAFANGSIDAVCSWQPYIYNCFEAITDPIIFNNQEYNSAFVLASTNDFVLKNKVNLTAFYAGLQKAINYLIHDKDAAMLIISKRTRCEITYLKSIWYDYNFSLEKRKFLINNLKSQEEWGKKNNVLDRNEKDIIWTDLVK